MNAALVGLHAKRLAAAHALALDAIRALSESVEAIRKAESVADFEFALPWPELSRLMKAGDDVRRIDYLAVLALRREVIAKHEKCCASAIEQLSQETENRRLLIERLRAEHSGAMRHAERRAAKANEVLAETKRHCARNVDVASGMANSEPPGGCAQLGCLLLSTAAWWSWVAMSDVRLEGLMWGAVGVLGIPLLGAHLPHFLRFSSKLLRVWKAETQARDAVAAAQAAYAKETADAEVELASASQSLGASLETAQKRFASAQSAVSGLVERLPNTCQTPESKTPPLSKASSGSGSGCVVSLTSAGSNIVAVIKSLRELVPGLGLAAAKALAENVPSIIGQGLTILEAENIRRRLEAVGAKVVIR